MESLRALAVAIGLDAGRYQSLLDDPRRLASELQMVGHATDDEIVLGMLARIAVGGALDESKQTLSRLAAWAQENFRSSTIAFAWAARRDGASLAHMLRTMIETVPAVVPFTAGVAVFLSDELKLTVLLTLAGHPSADTREHLFALLGTHRRLVPPGTISVRSMPDSVLIPLLEVGLSDPSPNVRVRAIAYAYGVGAVGKVRPHILRNLFHDDLTVRRYAMICLGVLADAESLEFLRAKLSSPEQGEVVASIWALARRPEGVGFVIEMAGRADLAEEIMGAIAEVSAPLDDETLARLRGAVYTPTAAQQIERHLDRTRLGAPERGSDGQVDYLVKAENAPRT